MATKYIVQYAFQGDTDPTVIICLRDGDDYDEQMSQTAQKNLILFGRYRQVWSFSTHNVEGLDQV